MKSIFKFRIILALLMKPIFWASLVIVLEKSEGTGKFDKWTVKGRKMTNASK